MRKLIAVAGVTFALTSSAFAMPPAPLVEPDGATITQVAFGCGAGRTRINGICVARTTRRHVRRCVRWYGGACAYWRYY